MASAMSDLNENMLIVVFLVRELRFFFVDQLLLIKKNIFFGLVSNFLIERYLKE